MKEKLIREVQHGLLGVLDQRQQEMLKSVLLRCLDGYTLTGEIKQEDNSNNYRYLDMFVSAKRVEGCSEKTVDYYTATIKRLLDTVKKDIGTLWPMIYGHIYPNIKSSTVRARLQWTTCAEYFRVSFRGSKMRTI